MSPVILQHRDNMTLVLRNRPVALTRIPMVPDRIDG